MMITSVYRDRLGIEGTEIVGRSAFHAAEKNLPNLFVCMDNFGMARPELEQRLADKKVILLLRDPRDVVISHYFSFAKRATAVERAAFEVPDSIESEGPFRFATNSTYGMPRIIDFMNYWFNAVRRHPCALNVRYEDLRQNTEAAFMPVMRFLLPDASASEIERAVAACSFERMKEMEAAGSFGLDLLGWTS
jgi:alcohol sulfotransferase